MVLRTNGGFFMNKFLGLLGFSEEKQTTVKTEIIAGLVTFLTMAYILTVNPSEILGHGAKGISWSSVFMATAFGAIIGTMLMAFLAKMPLAQASGMGLNATVGLMLGGVYGDFTNSGTFMVVLMSGIVFLALSLITIKGKTFRELVFDGMPVAVRAAISVGIGLFIAYIGFQNAGIIVAGPTITDLVTFSAWGEGWKVAVAPAVVALIGLLAIALLDKFEVKGGVIIGILIATIVGIPFGVTPYQKLYNGDVTWKFWENFADFFTVGEDSVFLSFTGVFKDGFGGSIFTIIMLTITFCMIDMFDTMGTIVGCCGGNRLLSDENDKPHNYDKIMISDSVATCAGAMLGTSTVTTFVESGSGISAGGRTGLTAFVVACLFFLSIFIMPVFAAIPSAATASALIWVGVLMMKNNVKSIDFSNTINAVSAFLTIVVMVLAYSITDGIGIGLVVYTVLSLISYGIEWLTYAINKKEDSAKPVFPVSVVSLVVTALFLVYFFVPTTL